MCSADGRVITLGRIPESPSPGECLGRNLKNSVSNYGSEIMAKIVFDKIRNFKLLEEADNE
jgi:hypothetical protein